MAKNQLIALELDRFEKIVKRYQDYLEEKNILKIEEAKIRHAEMDVQIKVINALPVWLSALEKLRGVEAKKETEIRADGELSGLMKSKMMDK